jgi:ATP-binding cassette, subfamily B, bacterial
MRKFTTGCRTLRLLYQMDRSAFVTSACASVLQALVYPALLIVVWQGFSLIVKGDSAGNLSIEQRAILLLAGFFGLLTLQTILQIVNETAAGLLRAESSQQVNGRIMAKMSDVPYRLFEDNAFQARYGLLISQAGYRPGMLVEAFVGTVSAFAGAIAIAVTLAALAPLLNIFLVILVPLAIVEARFHMRIIDLQTTSAPALFRMMHLTQKSVDATWQRDLRVYNSPILHQEYTALATDYLAELKRLLRRYQVIRMLVGMAAAVVMTGAMAAVFWHIAQQPDGLSQAVILVPALVMGLTQGRAFSSSWGSLSECLGYLSQVFEFLEQPFAETALLAA